MFLPPFSISGNVQPSPFLAFPSSGLSLSQTVLRIKKKKKSGKHVLVYVCVFVGVCAGGGRAGLDYGRGREHSHKPRRKVNGRGKIKFQ